MKLKLYFFISYLLVYYNRNLQRAKIKANAFKNEKKKDKTKRLRGKILNKCKNDKD